VPCLEPIYYCDLSVAARIDLRSLYRRLELVLQLLIARRIHRDAAGKMGTDATEEPAVRLSALTKEAASHSEAMVPMYQTTSRHVPVPCVYGHL
jgi:hypothetical protein